MVKIQYMHTKCRGDTKDHETGEMARDASWGIRLLQGELLPDS